MRRTRTYEHPGEAGTTVLGHLQVGDHVSLLQGGLPGGGFFDDLIQTIPTRPGRSEVWNGGLTWLRPRCGLPTALGGPDHAHTWIALIDTISE